jgi:hypothetical protein
MCRYVRGILRKSAWVAAALTIALSATPSKAGTLTVNFDLSGSSLALGTAINVSNGMGGTVAGMAQLVLTGVNAMGAITGAMAGATVQGLGLNIMLNSPILAGFDATLVGPITITQMGAAMGSFNGMAVSLPQNTFSTQLSTNINCAGGQCAAISALGMIMFPIVQNATISNNMGPFAVNVSGLNATAMLNAQVMAMNAGQAVTLTFSGREVMRNFMGAPMAPPPPPPNPMPEPVEAGLLILGVLALCGVSALRRQRVA